MDERKLKLALLQLLPTGTEDGNLKKGEKACREAAKMGADLALVPGMWSIGYDLRGYSSKAISSDGGFVGYFGVLAKELDMAVGITFLEAHHPRPRNTICLFDRHGELRYTYAKVHPCVFGDEAVLDGGDDFYVSELDTAAGPVKVGSMICYDREFPESARILMLKGAELILVPNACPMEVNRLSQLRGRAYENMLAIATCNYPAPHPDCNGHSTLFDGVAYLPELPGSRDTCVTELGEGEEIRIAELDLDMLRSYRSTEVHGNAYRRPEKYGLLLSGEIREPFIREDRRAD